MTDNSTHEQILGIDLGTTNSLAAVVGPNGPTVLPNGSAEDIIPSVVAILPNGEILVGQQAKALAFEAPERVIHSAKRLIGRSLSELRLETSRLPYSVVEGPNGGVRIRIPMDGKEGRPPFRDFAPEEISALVLREVHRRAEASLPASADKEPRQAVITVPAYFDEAQRGATKRAAELAGLHTARLVNEPTAASLAYGLRERGDAVVLVYDLGGGTFDVSILRLHDGIFRVLATHGDTQLGGDDFDLEIMNRILSRIEDVTGAKVADSPEVLASIRRSAEGIKCRLSEEDETELEIELGGSRPERLVLTRKDFESDIEDYVQRTLRSVEHAMTDAKLETSDIDEIVLVGGSTRVPRVREAIAERFGKKADELRKDIDPDLTVALGAAVQGSVLAGTEDDVLLLDVIPLSLGIETAGGAFSKLILRNSTVPCSVTEEFSTQVANQTGVDLNIFQGERELVRDCRRIASFRLTGIPPMPAGLPRVAVTFTIDADGILRVAARELRSGQTASVELRPTLGLSDSDVQDIVRDSIEHAGDDFAERELLELQSKAQLVIAGTRKALEEGGDALDPEQAYAIRKALKAVEKAAESGEGQALHAALERLSSYTMQLADDMIGAAVTRALQQGE